MEQNGLYAAIPAGIFLERIEKGLFYVALDEQDQVAGLMALLTEDPRWAEDEPKTATMCIIWQQGRTPRAPAERCWNFADSFRCRRASRVSAWIASWATTA